MSLKKGWLLTGFSAGAFLIALFPGVPAGEARAAPNCKKGIPCGNTCIAANRTAPDRNLSQP